MFCRQRNTHVPGAEHIAHVVARGDGSGRVVIAPAIFGGADAVAGAAGRRAGAPTGIGEHIGEQRSREERGARSKLLLDTQERVEQRALLELRRVPWALLLQVVIDFKSSNSI